MLNLLFILLACILVLLNAVFVAAEFGMVKLRATRIVTIAEEYGLRGRILMHVHQQLDAYLSACQLGITLASLGLGWIGEPAFAYLLAPLFKWMGMKSAEVIKVFSFFTAFSFISFLHIVVGELLPKSLAIRRAELISVWTAIPLYIFYWLMYPAIWLLNVCSNFLLKITGVGAAEHADVAYSTEEIKLILSASHLHGELTQAETEIIKRTLSFADLTVTEVMRPREAMIALDLQQPTEKLLQVIFEYRYSRYPVYEQDKENIIGMIHVKDLFLDYQQKQVFDLKSIMRPILKISHRLSTLDLLRQFREGMPHFALVYNASQVLVGFITLDNLLHVLIGRIKDEFHKTQEDWVKNPDGTILIQGNCSLYTLQKALGYKLKLSSKEKKLHTFTGFILARLGVLPKVDQLVSLNEFNFVIKKMQGAHILEVIIYPQGN